MGLCFGSFVNALVWRIHEQDEVGRRAKGRGRSGKTQDSRLTTHVSRLKTQDSRLTTQDLSITKGRSMCPHCRHTLAWYDLLPVISWLSLRGRCRYCHKPISWQYPLVELISAGLFVLSYHFYATFHLPSSIFLFTVWLIILTGLIALTIYDLRWMLLPDRIVFPLQALAGLYVLMHFALAKGDWHIFLGAVMGVVFSAGLFYLLFQVSGGKWIGGGDVKLAVVLGLVLGGAVPALLMIFISSILGSIVGLPLILAKKSKLQSKIPFGPFLITATIIVYLFGASIISWYKNQILLV